MTNVEDKSITKKHLKSIVRLAEPEDLGSNFIGQIEVVQIEEPFCYILDDDGSCELPIHPIVMARLSKSIMAMIYGEVGTVFSLYAKFGKSMIPVLQRGVFSLSYDRFFSDHSQPNPKKKDVKIKSHPVVKVARICVPEAVDLHNMVALRGEGEVEASFEEMGIRWEFCRKSMDEKVDCPHNVFRFISDYRKRGETLSFSSAKTYEFKNEQYVYQKFGVHTEQVKQLLPFLSDLGKIIEPAAGVGILCRVRKDVEASDRVKTSMSWASLQEKEISDALKSQGVIFLMYCWTFLTDEDKEHLSTRKVVVVDDERMKIPYPRIQRNLWINGIDSPMVDSWVRGDKSSSSETLDYTENLIKRGPYIVPFFNESYHYLKGMIPTLSHTHYSLGQKKKFTAKDGRSVLIGDLREMEIFLKEPNLCHLPAYFSPIGDSLQIKDFVVQRHLTDISLQKRTVYRSPDSPLLRSIMSKLPGLLIGKNYYFYYGGNDHYSWTWKYATPTEVVAGKVHVLDVLPDGVEILEATKKRVYRYAGNKVLSVDPYEDTVLNLKRFLRRYYYFGVSRTVWDYVSAIWKVSATSAIEKQIGTPQWVSAIT